MKNPEIVKTWEDFMKDSQYSVYFISYEEKWNNIFNEVKQFIDINKRYPNSSSKNKEEKCLAIWLCNQKKKYKKKKKSMNNPKKSKKWKKFIK